MVWCVVVCALRFTRSVVAKNPWLTRHTRISRIKPICVVRILLSRTESKYVQRADTRILSQASRTRRLWAKPRWLIPGKGCRGVGVTVGVTVRGPLDRVRSTGISFNHGCFTTNSGKPPPVCVCVCVCATHTMSTSGSSQTCRQNKNLSLDLPGAAINNRGSPRCIRPTL